MIEAFLPFGAVLDRLVHKRAGDAVARFRHRAFLTAHLTGGIAGVLAVPIYLAVFGAPSAQEVLAFAWLGTPLLLSVDLAQNGRLARSEFLSIANFSALVALAAWFCGGLGSSFIGWFIPVLLLAASTGRRATLLNAALLVMLSLLGLVAAQIIAAPAHQTSPGPLWIIALSVAALISVTYAVAVATGLEVANDQAALLLVEEEARYRLLAENATDLITRHTRSGNVLFASPAALDLAGSDPAELLNDGLFSRVHVADRPAFLSVFADAAESGKTATVEFRLRKGGDGAPQWRWVEMRCRRFRGQTHSPILELVAVTRDIEARHRQEEALREANAATERASAAKTRFLANISHELRTPLNAIIGFSEMLSLDMPVKATPERVVEYASLINESGRHLLDVVNGILDMSKLEAGSFAITPEPFDVAALAQNAVATVKPIAEKAGIGLSCDGPGEAREINADRRACKQILLNLLSNAIKFTERGGEASLAIAFDEKNVFLTVRDTGIGIDEKDLPLLATPFMQAQSSYDRRYEGTGLGLSLVKGLAELHGGELSIRSKLGVGTTVTVRLPIDSEHPGASVRQLPVQRQERGAAKEPRRKSVA